MFPLAHATAVATALLACSLCASIATGQNAPPSVPYMPDGFDVSKVLGFEQCQKCHTEQVAILKQHPHFSHARPMQRDPAAIAMAKLLGKSSIKRNERCIRCHYTPQQSSRGVRAISAVSCESCHGPSQDWLLVHNVYGGPTVTQQTETASHRAKRHQRSIELGMRHPSNLYSLARSCYRCHVVDDEELVNIAGHVPRSEGFNLVAWSQGNVRHNFLRTSGASNAVSAPERQQLMLVIGIATDLEYSLRAVAKATERGKFAANHATRCRALQAVLGEIQQRVQDDRLAQVISIVSELKFGLKQTDSFRIAADKISKITWAISTQPADYSAINDMLPKPSEYKGQAASLR